MSLHRLLMILIMAAVVILLRAFPFIVFGGGNRKVPRILVTLGQVMTAAAIAMLVVYSYAGLCDFGNPDFGRLLAGIPAAILTVILQFTIRNPLVSICAGTALYMCILHLA